MQTRADAVGRRDWLWFWMTLILFVLGQSGAFAQPSCCGGSGCCGGPPEQACTLTYGARGVVRDSVTGNPIPNASIYVLNAGGASASDGSFDVSGSRAETCHIDYYYTLLVTKTGYNPFGMTLYTSAVYPTLTIELDPESATTHVKVSGLVTEFPLCGGAMRGVGVRLDPLHMFATTSVADGRFEFHNVPPGDYTLSVVPECNPFGCWEVENVHVSADDVDLTVCMTAIDPDATPTPTPTVYPGPSITATVCPAKTPCVLGEEPVPCGERCGLGCGCQGCGACPPGYVSEPRPNFCECVPDPNVTPPPTSTPGNCFFPTPPLCPVGQTAQCVTEGGCDSDCSCVACDPCPPGLSYSGEPNSCACVDPRTVTATPTPDSRTATPTPPFCPGATPPLCPPGEAPECIQTDCIIGCSCEPCNECLPGLIRTGEVNRCDCIDPRTPSERPTETPSPRLDTPGPCPTRTQLACPSGEASVCDTSVDPCGICECRAVPQAPSDEDTLSANSSGGCRIATPSDADGSWWSWSLLLIAILGWQRARLRRRSL